MIFCTRIIIRLKQDVEERARQSEVRLNLEKTLYVDSTRNIGVLIGRDNLQII